jgi:two-component system NarL family sensor kinase
VKYVFESALDRARHGHADAEVTPRLESGVERLREVLGEVRRISHDLRPALLDDLGLARALEHLGREWSSRSGVALDADCEDPGPLPEGVATAVFRIAQEALGNVERHAAAREVHLRLRRGGGGLRFEVIDDGSGFDVDALQRSPRSGLGLTHMRERVESLGGRFELSANGGGTRLAAFFPDAHLGT